MWQDTISTPPIWPSFTGFNPAVLSVILVLYVLFPSY